MSQDGNVACCLSHVSHVCLSNLYCPPGPLSACSHICVQGAERKNSDMISWPGEHPSKLRDRAENADAWALSPAWAVGS